MRRNREDLDLVGIVEIAHRLRVSTVSIYTWIDRGDLPPPRWRVGGTSIWDWADIERWGAHERGTALFRERLAAAGRD